MRIIFSPKYFKAIIFLMIFIVFGFSSIPGESGIEIYGVKNHFKNKIENCHYCFNEKEIILSKEPLLGEKDISYFDWKNQQILLSETGKIKVSNLKIQLSGMPVVLVLNKKVIYGFWFWNKFSSFGCDRVYTYPQKDFKIKFGLPLKNTFGVDPRYNKELEKYILNRFPQN